VGILSAFVDLAPSSPPNDGGIGSGSGTIAMSAMMHLASADRVNLDNYATCLYRLARVVALPAHPDNRDDNDCNGSRLE
jgi:hypothetical protein